MLLLPFVVTVRVVVAVIACTAVFVVGYKDSSVVEAVIVSVGVGRGESSFVANCIAVCVRVLACSVARFVVTGVIVDRILVGVIAAVGRG